MVRDRADSLERGEITSEEKALTCQLIIHSCSRLQQGCNGTQASNKHDRDDGLKIRKPQTSTDIPVCWPPKERGR